MKRIYAFTLDGDESASEKFGSDLRLMAYLMYDFIYNYDGENSTALIINKNIVYNCIREKLCSNEYYLDSDMYDDGYINYEPFLIGKRSFALTIDDEIMSEDVIRELIQYTLRIAKLNYNFKITSMTYSSVNKDDERNRRKTINSLIASLGCEPVKKHIFSRKRVLNSSLYNKKIGILGR